MDFFDENVAKTFLVDPSKKFTCRDLKLFFSNLTGSRVWGSGDDRL